MTPPTPVMFVSRYMFCLIGTTQVAFPSRPCGKSKAKPRSSADAEFLFDFSEFVEVLALQVLKQPLAVTHHFEQTMPGTVILLIPPKVLFEMLDARR